jgi:hypothetical protein
MPMRLGEEVQEVPRSHGVGRCDKAMPHHLQGAGTVIGHPHPEVHRVVRNWPGAKEVVKY